MLTLGWCRDTVYLTEFSASAEAIRRPGSFCFVFSEASHHEGHSMTLLERKDLENEMTCGEACPGRSTEVPDMPR